MSIAARDDTHEADDDFLRETRETCEYIIDHLYGQAMKRYALSRLISANVELAQRAHAAAMQAGIAEIQPGQVRKV